MKKKALIVVGLGYGDEGKGLTTDYLCSKSENPIVIRYNGGQQAGHTVFLKDGTKHIFSNFGSGSFQKAPTYWSNKCTFSLTHFLEEYSILPVQPRFYLDVLCPVTTHYDVLFNRALENSRGESRYGSCGVGFGATVERHENLSTFFVAQDFLIPSECVKKLKIIREYYKEKINNETLYDFDHFNHDQQDDEFQNEIAEINTLIANGIVSLISEEEIFCNDLWSTYIFEGAQGILLDKNFGNYPYITKSNTTSQNALELLKKHSKHPVETEIFYVTRAYLTRHGAGPFLQTNPNVQLKNIGCESNIDNQFQGRFKITNLNIELLNYALECDDKFSKGLKKNLIVTCVDQLTTDGIPIYHDGLIKIIPYQEISNYLNHDFKEVKFSFSNLPNNLV